MLEAGIVTLQRSRTSPYGVRAGAFVGHAVISPTRRLVVAEKTPGALQALLHWTVPSSLREAQAPSATPPTHAEDLFALFARRFLTHLAEYVRHGRLKEYQTRVFSTNRPRGKIAPRATARLRARGWKPELASYHSVLTADLLPNQLLALGLTALESYFRFTPGSESFVDEARFLAPLFEDVDRNRLEQLDRSERSEVFRQAMSDSHVGGQLAHALAYARALVLHLGPWEDQEWDEGIPTSFFLNLQTLFEDAVRQVLSETAKAPVSRGADLAVPLLQERPTDYHVHPDLVIGRPGAIALVLDCKYKDLIALPAHEDVYQLAAHATAMGCGNAMLVYPGVEKSAHHLGSTAAGVDISWTTVRLPQLKADLNDLLVATFGP